MAIAIGFWYFYGRYWPQSAVPISVPSGAYLPPIPKTLRAIISQTTQTPIGSIPSKNITYTDPGGEFLFEYPNNFAIGTSAAVVEINLGEIVYGSEFLQGQAFSTGSDPFPNTDFKGVSFDIYENTSTPSSSCDRFNGKTSSGTSEEATYNNIEWHEDSTGAVVTNTDTIDDHYQTYRSNGCWSGVFQWVLDPEVMGVPIDPSQPSGEVVRPLGRVDISSFERLILGSLRFLR